MGIFRLSLLESIAYFLQFATRLHMQHTVATSSTNRNSSNTPATAPVNYRAIKKIINNLNFHTTGFITHQLLQVIGCWC